MLVPKTQRRVFSLNLDDASDRETYEGVLNNPAMKILTKRHVTQTETVNEGDSSTSTSQQYIYLEVEECHL